LFFGFNNLMMANDASHVVLSATLDGAIRRQQVTPPPAKPPIAPKSGAKKLFTRSDNWVKCFDQYHTFKGVVSLDCEWFSSSSGLE
jgi:hypothetical protein